MENRNQKTKRALLCGVLIVAMISCHNGTGMNNNNAVEQTTDTAKSISIISGTHCFAFTNNNDSIFLTVTIKGKLATGNLIYALREKDRTRGTIKGQFYGDTLLADYFFISEGKQSIRQVIFLRKGNIFQEGYGSMKVENGKLVFTHISDISFTGNVVLLPVDCKSFEKK